MPAIREPHKMFAACLNFYRSNPAGGEGVRKSSMFAHIQEALGGYLAGLSVLQESAYPGWKADQDNPGHMIRIDPPVVIRAPYHLVCAFPSEANLDAIWHLSRKVKTLDTSVLCLSGSLAIVKSSISICDIDFCEYVTGSPNEITEALTGKMRGIHELVFRRVQVGSANTDQVCDDEDIRARLSAIKPNDPELSHAKIDFIGKPGGLRPTDISNVIIFCDEKWGSASLHRSFTAQEAHLDPVVAVPNKLCEPYEIGRYIDFLLGQAHSYYAKRDFAKALKRCLSLARLCFLSAISEEVTDFVIGSPDFLEREIASIDELIADISSSGLEVPDWVDDLEWAKEGLEQNLTRVRKRPARETIQAFCERILATLTSALAGQDLKAA